MAREGLCALGRPCAAFSKIKKGRKFRFIVLVAREDTFELKVETLGEPSKTAKDFVAALPADEARFAVYQHELKKADGRLKETLYFVTWSPPSARSMGRQSVLYSSQKLPVRAALPGVTELAGTSPEQLLRVIGVTDETRKPDADDDEDWDPDA